MGDNVWIQQFAAAADFVLSLLGYLKKTETINAGGLSPVVPESAAATTSTLNATTVLAIERMSETLDATFGRATIGNEFVCYTMERTAVIIPAGKYKGHKRFSPHLNRTVVGIDVPGRTDIEGHNANLPGQLQGCIAFGSSIDGDALDNSIAALEKVLSLLPDSFIVSVTANYK